jgi:hypothetical protein
VSPYTIAVVIDEEFTVALFNNRKRSTSVVRT